MMAKEFPALERASLYKQVARQIGLSIIRRDYLPGEALASEPELSVQLNVSRTVLREALKTLSAKGLVEARPKIGTRVLPRARWNLLDPEILAWHYEAGPDTEFLRALSEVRLMLEPMAARLAAERATEEEIREIAHCCQEMAAVTDDAEKYIVIDLNFHLLICDAAHNELLRSIMQTLSQAMRASRLVTAQIPGGNREAMPLHTNIVQAIQQRDGSAAELAARTLIELTMQDISRVLEGEPVRE
ncbi:FadR/GntR family transcriptional regulator [Ktedonobacter sp. SOSP1-85]|uniref:FadR/GntR family transcriptional regulator n=1 Tax=Ktedonobacter sp. SOSP1-85 TaxID=2778367 RepID=UPI001915C12E|nr:FadR/GntR family transcriptional regulator [Ktedonobacter sp. SOSP1-85]